MQLAGIICVQPGNTVNITFGDRSKNLLLANAQRLLRENPKGFDPGTMQAVVPLVPFKPGTRERYPDLGVHLTLALEGRAPWKDADGTPDKVTEEMKEIMHGREIDVVIDTNEWVYLEGDPKNDEGTQVVFRMVSKLSKAAEQKHEELRAELNLGPMAAEGLPHLTLAGIKPSNGDFADFRTRFCRPRPKIGFPAPYPRLVQQQMWYKNPCVARIAMAISIAILAGAIAIHRM